MLYQQPMLKGTVKPAYRPTVHLVHASDTPWHCMCSTQLNAGLFIMQGGADQSTQQTPWLKGWAHKL